MAAGREGGTKLMENILTCFLLNLIVSSTLSLASVWEGSRARRRNGSIFLYVHQTLLEACQGEARDGQDEATGVQ